ncbi:MAG TPA: DsbA family oxidoreductase [Thermohalobaculum sp.]|nr:DsbA family oxidoreductase [Thermohalobaculum sp.]
MGRMVPLDIISDPICPWCYIGKARLDAAIAEAGQDPFVQRWRIFQLNPDMPAEGMDRRAYLEAKFGGPDGAAQVYDRIAREAEANGLALDFDRIARTPNTMDAHRLIRWSETTGNQPAVAHQLFVRYFERGEDISDRAVLLDVAESAGMERDVVARLLESDADIAELGEEDAEARRMGVTGVPTFIVAGRYVLQGAQETATWVRAIREIGQAIEAQQPAGAG